MTSVSNNEKEALKALNIKNKASISADVDELKENIVKSKLADFRIESRRSSWLDLGKKLVTGQVEKSTSTPLGGEGWRCATTAAGVASIGAVNAPDATEIASIGGDYFMCATGPSTCVGFESGVKWGTCQAAAAWL